MVGFRKIDTMELAGWVMQEIQERSPRAVAIDVIGIGSACYDRLRELRPEVNGELVDLNAVNVAEKAAKDEKFMRLERRVVVAAEGEIRKPARFGYRRTRNRSVS